MINTKFWSDSWVREKINPLDRYLFLYFLTNEHTSICGIYELSMSTICFETGIDRDELQRVMLPRLQPKLYYIDGWVIIPNFIKHQNQNSPKILKGIESELEEVPPDIMQKAKECGYDKIRYGYPMDTLSNGIDTLSHSNPKHNINSNPKISFDDFWGIYPKKVGKQKTKELWNKLKTEDQEKIMEDIPKRQAGDDKWVNGFVKDPERYIKHRQWEDEIIKPRGQVEPQRKVDSFIKK